MMQYRLNTDCPVKWTATQEKSISRELPELELSSMSVTDYVARTYQQALWLPESLMPLDRLVPAILAVNSGHGSSYSSTDTTAGPIHAILKPYLLAPRLITEKYHKRISAIMDDDYSGEGDQDDELMWFTLRHAKIEMEDEDISGEDQGAAEQRYKQMWLARMEERETMIQILLHLLLLSLPGLPQHGLVPKPKTRSSDILASSSSPRKRQQMSEPDTALSTDLLEAQLEMLMDRLAMWQLMTSIDKGAGRENQLRHPRRLASSVKNKQKEVDDRDWMQLFCEEVVEPLFQIKLPAQCSLLRSKVFQSSPFEDSDSFSLTGTPPASPKTAQNPLRLSRRGGMTDSQSEISSSRTTTQARDLSRSRSLSMSLEAERVRDRSKSLTIGPGNMHKHTLAREVSMTTAFKMKAKQKAADQRGKRPTMSKSKSVLDASTSKGKQGRLMGTTLVAATPVKPKPRTARKSSEERDLLPVVAENARPFYDDVEVRAQEGDDNDEDWVPQSSPDVLLLTANSSNSPGDSEGKRTARRHLSLGRRRVLAEATPTKPKRPKT